MSNKRLVSFFSLVLFIVVSGLTSGCGGNAANNASRDLMMAPLDQMPQEVQSAPVPVQQAYQFAVANPDMMKQIPCYCGCGNIGHTSNYACYVAGTEAGGQIKFDSHALGCSICVDIAQDTMRLRKQGQSPPEIKSYVDSAYSKYGPSNMP